MLINAQRAEQLRVAVVDRGRLENYQVEAAEATQTRGNIYRGIVASLNPSLGAAFIDYGPEKNGFLSMDNLVPDAWHRNPSSGRRPSIDDVLEKGRPILVQVVREPEGQKGGNLTTNLSLAGRYLVFTPFDDTQGVSRKVEDEDERQQLRDLASSLRVPDGGGVIIRTNAAGQNKTSVARDLQALLRLWKQIRAESKKGSGPALLQSDQDLILRALRDYLDASIDEVVIDDERAWEKAQEYIRAFLPRSQTRLVRYSDRAPLFSRHDLDAQIDRIYERSVALPAGGSIVIDRTEALVAIDVNSGRARSGGGHEETVVQTNLEAAREVGRQLQLRDIGGLIVVDFIDMKSPGNRRKVEAAMKEALKTDKARTSVGRISANGLLEINRQKIRQALHLRTHRACPTCAGTGRIASPEMVSLNLLRRIEARAATVRLRSVRIELHPELADAFQNSRRQEIAALEREFSLEIEIIAASHLHRPEQELEWIEAEQSAPTAASAPSSAAASDPLPAESGGGRKRRRRRRRRGGESGPAEAFANVPEPAPGVESFERDFPVRDPEPADSEAEPAAAPESPARRKRKRRRRGRGGAGGETAVTPAEPSDAGEADEPPAGERIAVADEGPRPPSRRRRRRGGSHRTGPAQAEPPSLGGEPEPGVEPAGEPPSFWDASEPSTRRPRRHRNSKEPAAD